MAQKNVVLQNNKINQPVKTKSYRGISTVADPKKINLYDLDLIKQDIINHFHIRQGEKLENPTFGTIIWDALFEPLTVPMKNAIKKNVTDIVNYDPRVRANEVKIDQYENGLQIEVNLTYKDYSISETLQLRFDQQAGLI
jgi:phage baseplate assembly protein W